MAKSYDPYDPFDWFSEDWWLRPKPEPQNALLALFEPQRTNALCPPPPTRSFFGSLSPPKPKTVWVKGYWWTNPFYPYDEVWIDGHYRSLP